MPPRTRKPLKCTCSRHHLLAFYGLNADGDPYVHIKAHRQGRVIVNVVILSDVEIQCPSCGMWVAPTIGEDGEVEFEELCEPPAETVEMQTLEYTNNA